MLLNQLDLVQNLSGENPAIVKDPKTSDPQHGQNARAHHEFSNTITLAVRSVDTQSETLPQKVQEKTLRGTLREAQAVEDSIKPSN